MSLDSLIKTTRGLTVVVSELEKRKVATRLLLAGKLLTKLEFKNNEHRLVGILENTDKTI